MPSLPEQLLLGSWMPQIRCVPTSKRVQVFLFSAKGHIVNIAAGAQEMRAAGHHFSKPKVSQGRRLQSSG